MAPEDTSIMSTELKWWHIAIMGGMGAGGGYLMLKDKIGKYPSAAGGALATVLTVLAFRPGGWLRSSTTADAKKIRGAQRGRFT